MDVDVKESALAVTVAAIVVTRVTIVVAVVAAIVVVAVVVGVIVVGVVKLAGWTKAEQVASPTGLGPCLYPLPASGSIDPSSGLTPSL